MIPHAAWQSGIRSRFASCPLPPTGSLDVRPDGAATPSARKSVAAISGPAMRRAATTTSPSTPPCARLRPTSANVNHPIRRSTIQDQDLQRKVRVHKTGNLVVFAVDASWSMAAAERMEATKGAIMSLLVDAYQKRDRVAMVSFPKGSRLPRSPAHVERGDGQKCPAAHSRGRQDASLRRPAAVVSGHRARAEPDSRHLLR